VDALHAYVKNMYFNKSIIFKNQKSQAIATIRHLQKIDLFAKTRAECQINDPAAFYDSHARDCKLCPSLKPGGNRENCDTNGDMDAAGV